MGANDNYTNSALRVGDVDHLSAAARRRVHRHRRVQHLGQRRIQARRPQGARARAEGLCRPDVPPALPVARRRRGLDAPADERLPRRPGRGSDRIPLQDRGPRHPRHGDCWRRATTSTSPARSASASRSSPAWKNIVVLGRGVGLATLAPLSQLAAENGVGVTAILSARHRRRRDVEGAVRRVSAPAPSRCSIPTTAARSRTSRRSSRT